jgi:hypothetical protein
MRLRLLFRVLFLLTILAGCGSKNPEPEGIYQNTSHNTGKSVQFDFKKNGEVDVQVSYVEISASIVDDAFFPFFSEGSVTCRWRMEGNGRSVSIRGANDFEIVRLEYTGKGLAWDKTKFRKLN